MLEIYTDGSARGNGTNHAEGGYGVIVLKDGKLIDAYSRQFDNVTNNQMELKAILYAMVKYGKYSPIVYSDSAYAINTFSNWMYGWERAGWKKSDKKVPENLDIIKAYYDLEQNGYKLNLIKVRGHMGNYWNEIADDLATGRTKPNELFPRNESLDKINIKNLTL